MPHRLHPDSRLALVDALNAEWADWHTDGVLGAHHRAEFRRWARRHPQLTGCQTGSQILAAVRCDPDPVLGALIAVQQERLTGTPAGGSRAAAPRVDRSEHPLAGRIVIQAMLGKLITMAHRDRAHGVEDYVGQLWLRIGHYPLTRRPRRIAANLCLDTLKGVVADGRRDRRLPGGTPVPVSPHELEQAGLTVAKGDDGEPESVADLTAHRVLRTALRLGLIDEATRSLLLSVYADGLTSADAGDRHGLTATTVRFRCSHAVRRLAEHSVEISDAA